MTDVVDADLTLSRRKLIGLSQNAIFPDHSKHPECFDVLIIVGHCWSLVGTSIAQIRCSDDSKELRDFGSRD